MITKMYFVKVVFRCNGDDRVFVWPFLYRRVDNIVSVSARTLFHKSEKGYEKFLAESVHTIVVNEGAFMHTEASLIKPLIAQLGATL